ncbi:hypothetical protein ACXR2U_06295 [Jatrophihabitans sp. YIM 134969]
MTDPSSSWTELRYTSAQPLPEPDGLRDELDGIVLWTVEAVQCFHDHPEQVVARSDIAVFDLECGLDLATPAMAYGGGVRTAAELVLTPDGRLRPDLEYTGVDAFVLFQQVVIAGVARGMGLAATLAVRDRIATRRSLVGCLPDPPALNSEDPEFFRGVPAAMQQSWWDRGLFHRGNGLWLVPPDGQASQRA